MIINKLKETNGFICSYITRTESNLWINVILVENRVQNADKTSKFFVLELVRCSGRILILEHMKT